MAGTADDSVPLYRKPAERRGDYNSVMLPSSEKRTAEFAANCQDCGVPFCQGMSGPIPNPDDVGCPVANEPEQFNKYAKEKKWAPAVRRLHSTNNFPEFTGAVCPAPCMQACTDGINGPPVNIKEVERGLAEAGWQQGLIVPVAPRARTGKRVAIVGSGPAGLATAQQLARAGHAVVLFEKNERVGGLLRYGIPDFKMEKHLIDRRVQQMVAEGVEFRTGQRVDDYMAQKLLKDFDAMVVAIGAEKPRDLPVPGRDLQGIHFAMDFLPQTNHWQSGEAGRPEIFAEGLHVVVIGGGDTGSDCIGTSDRHGAATITQLEILPRPQDRDAGAWPGRPNELNISTSHEESGAERKFSVVTKEFRGENGRLTELLCAEVEWTRDDAGRWGMSEKPGSEFTLKADLALLAMGFEGPVRDGLITQLGIEFSGGRPATTDGFQSSANPKVFFAGDVNGQSIVVRAIRSGRIAAERVDAFLQGFAYADENNRAFRPKQPSVAPNTPARLRAFLGGLGAGGS